MHECSSMKIKRDWKKISIHIERYTLENTFLPNIPFPSHREHFLYIVPTCSLKLIQPKHRFITCHGHGPTPVNICMCGVLEKQRSIITVTIYSLTIVLRVIYSLTDLGDAVVDSRVFWVYWMFSLSIQLTSGCFLVC